MKKEADVKAEVKKILRSLGAWWYMPVPAGYGSNEVVDFMPVTYRGLSIIIETKFSKNAKCVPGVRWRDRGATAGQARALTNHEQAGGISLLIDETNVGGLEARLREILR